MVNHNIAKPKLKPFVVPRKVGRWPMTTMDGTDHDQPERVIRPLVLPLAPFILHHPSSSSANLLYSVRELPFSHDYDSHLQVIPVSDLGFTPLSLAIG